MSKHEFLVCSTNLTNWCSWLNSKCLIGGLQVVSAATCLPFKEIDDDLDALFREAKTIRESFERRLFCWADSPVSESNLNGNSQQDKAVVSFEQPHLKISATR